MVQMYRVRGYAPPTASAAAAAAPAMRAAVAATRAAEASAAPGLDWSAIGASKGFSLGARRCTYAHDDR